MKALALSAPIRPTIHYFSLPQHAEMLAMISQGQGTMANILEPGSHALIPHDVAAEAVNLKRAKMLG